MELMLVIFFACMIIVMAILTMRKRERPVAAHQPSESYWAILEKFGDFLATQDKGGRCIFSEELLPFPKGQIEWALNQALSTVSEKKARVLLENNRAMLACFVPADEVPKDATGDLEFLEATWKDDPAGQRLLCVIRIRALGPEAFAARLNAMPPEQLADLLEKLKLRDREHD